MRGRMEEIRTVAVALYENGAAVSQAAVQDFFHSMDTDRSGSISKDEFIRFLDEKCPGEFNNPAFFSVLDEDGNGSLDFKEVLAFFYFTKYRGVFCQGTGCRKFLFGLYFTCIFCFAERRCYDLCLNCFQSKNHNHGHTQFLDNYSMLIEVKKNAAATGSWNEIFQSKLYFGVSKELSPPTKVGEGKHAATRCNMEDIRRAAVALYNNGSYQSQAALQDFFRSMDTDRSGSVSKEEFRLYLDENCPGVFNETKFFPMLDVDGSGTLDFTELVTFVYMTNSRAVYCQGSGCGKFLFSLYFTCVDCFGDEKCKTTYDLCLDCFRTKNHQNHNSQHTLFLDNYAVLKLLMKPRENDAGQKYAAPTGSSSATAPTGSSSAGPTGSSSATGPTGSSSAGPTGSSRATGPTGSSSATGPTGSPSARPTRSPSARPTRSPSAGPTRSPENLKMREGIRTAGEVMDTAGKVVGIAGNAVGIAGNVMGAMNAANAAANAANTAFNVGSAANTAFNVGLNVGSAANNVVGAMGTASSVMGVTSYALTGGSYALTGAAALCTIM